MAGTKAKLLPQEMPIWWYRRYHWHWMVRMGCSESEGDQLAWLLPLPDGIGPHLLVYRNLSRFLHLLPSASLKHPLLLQLLILPQQMNLLLLLQLH